MVLLFLAFLAGAVCLSCGDTSTQGDVRDNWIVNVLLARNGETGFVQVYAEIYKNDSPYVSAVLKVDDQSIPSNVNGIYQANLDPALLSDTSEITISTPLDPFQFTQIIVVPDTFSFDFDQLPNQQVFASTNTVSVRWNASDFEGMQGSYFLVVEPSSQANTAVGAFELYDGRLGSIGREAFRTSQGDFQTGTYNVWVVSRVSEPMDVPPLPFTIPDGIFTQNINRVGVKGQIGAIYISPRKTITAVVGS